MHVYKCSCPGIHIARVTPQALPKDVLLQESLVEIRKVELNDGVLEFQIGKDKWA